MRMNLNIGIVFLSLLFTTVVFAQEVDEKPFPKVPKTADKPEDFAPQGWKTETIVKGDLNGDKLDDVALTLTNGEQGYNEETQRSSFITRVLVLAFQGTDGKFNRSAVSAEAVLDGDEGGVMGDPFQELKIERGAVVIVHYGGSRNRWGMTNTYRWQQGKWMLIGLNNSSLDTLDLDYEDSKDTNLSTGLVKAFFSVEINQETGDRKPGKEGSYYELQAIPESVAPKIDGVVGQNEWNGYSVNLNNKRQVYKGQSIWKSATDLSAKLMAVCVGDQIYLLTEVMDNDFSKGDAVRLVNKKGIVIVPKEIKTAKTNQGYVVEARYSILDIARATLGKNSDALKYLEETLPNWKTADEIGGAAFDASVEVFDVDAGKNRAVMSTRLAGSPYTGSIRTYQGKIVFLSDIK